MMLGMGVFQRGALTLSLAAAASAVLAASTAAAALTIEVPAGTADSAAACAGSPCPNLRSAVGLANANPGSTIVLGGGTYPLSLGQLTIEASTSIAGSGPSATRILQ